MPRKIVINRCYGGYSLSQRAKDMYREATQDTLKGGDFYADTDIPRDDPALIKIIEGLGLKESAGHFAKLKIIEIPDDVPDDGWIIQDYDGIEWVAEKHRTWSGNENEQEQPGSPLAREAITTVLVKPDLQEDELETKEQ
jgi:hypothetical protein